MFIKLLAICIPVFLIIDLTWITVVAKSFYQTEIGSMLREDFKIAPAMFFYIMFCVALTVFVIQPAVLDNSLMKAALLGGFFGFITYLTFDATSYAIFKDYTLKACLVDTIWGTSIGAITSILTTYIFLLIKS